MKIAATSASGQLGSAVIKHLINQIGNDNVIGIARTPAKAEHLGVEIREGDYNSQPQFERALKGVDALLLVSGMDEPEKRIAQHRHVIEAAKHNGVKKIVYTSIVGDAEQTAFSGVVKSNRQTEQDVQASGLEWVIGRNGIYIEPDLEYIESYKQDGEIRNCAADGKCSYTSRDELGYAYAHLLLEQKHNGQTYNLVGEPITQTQLAECMNQVFNTNLTYNAVSVAAFEKERKAALGDFLGQIIAGIYEGIKIGANEVDSDFEKATGRAHKTATEMMRAFASQ